MRIVWLSITQRDLLSISAYYGSAANKDVLKRVLQRIVRSAPSLIDNPYLAHPSESRRHA
jgi:plasmid stabilization system protein ParE